MIDNMIRTALIKRAVDGDTVEVYLEMLRIGKYVFPWDNALIRLSICDTPERGQEGYQEAKEFTAQFVGQTVNVEIHKMEPHGRILATIRVNYEDKNENLSSLLMQKGLAKVYGT